MISNYYKKQQQQQKSKQKHFNNCLFKFNKTKIFSLDNSFTKTTSLDSKILKTIMSTMTADLHAAGKAAATGKVANSPTMKPPMEAVVVNSIIYSKPSFCGIVVDLGGGSITGEISMTKDKLSKLPNKISTNEGFHPPTMGIKPALTTFTTACLKGFTCSQQPRPSMAAQTKDAQVYGLCTTMNGSIHHQISDLCDNLLALAGDFGVTTNQRDNDDDSFIEFAYDDGDYEDDEESEEDIDDEENEEDLDDEEETDEDDDIDIEYDHNFNDYGDDDDDYLDAHKDVTDSSYGRSSENAPILNCDKRKKVRFNTTPTVHVMHTWNYAYRAARKGQWEMYARDRERFRLRVLRASLILNPILEREHRQKIFEKHFVDDQKQLQYPKVQVKSEVKQNAENIEAKTESKNIYQKPKRKKRNKFCKMGNKHYF